MTHVGQGVNLLREGDHAIVTWVSRSPRPGVPDPTVSPATYREEPLYGRNTFTWAEDVSLDAEFVVPIPQDAPTDISCIVGCAVLTGAGAVLHTANVRPGRLGGRVRRGRRRPFGRANGRAAGGRPDHCC